MPLLNDRLDRIEQELKTNNEIIGRLISLCDNLANRYITTSEKMDELNNEIVRLQGNILALFQLYDQEWND